MKKTVLLFLLMGIVYLCPAQTTIVRDPEIENMVKEVNADSLQSYVRGMVAFGTRSTVSSVTDKKRGIGAARNWVLARFNQWAAASGGRMTVFIDTTMYP